MTASDTIGIDQLSEEQLRRITEDILQGNTTIQEVKGLSDAEVEGIYAVAHSLYQAGRYDEARPIFNTLVLFNPYRGKHWLGLAACLQLLQLHDEALRAYAMAALTSTPRDPVPHFHAGECYLAMADPAEAAKAFRMAVDFGGDQEQYGRLTSKAKGLLDLIRERTSHD